MCYDVINLLCLLVFMHLKNIEVWIHELLFCGAAELSFLLLEDKQRFKCGGI